MRSGVRCAETTPTSNGTSNSASAWAASSITDQSLSLPMITPTRGPGVLGVMVMVAPSVGPFRMREPVRRPRRAFPHICDVRVVVERAVRRAKHIDVSDLAARPLTLVVQVHLCLGHPAEQVVHPLVHAHRRSLLRANHIGHHGNWCDRCRVAERIVEDRTQVLFELTGARAIDAP